MQGNAGALGTPNTSLRAAALGPGARDLLERNDCYGFFVALGDLVGPGPTFTHVNDLRALRVVPGRSAGSCCATWLRV